MAQRVGQTREHLGGIYHRFTALSARYWWLYVLAVVLYELVLDRALGWLNAKVDETRAGAGSCARVAQRQG